MPIPGSADSHQLTALALATLEDAYARASCGPARRDWGDRLALRWLVAAGLAERWQARQFWQALNDQLSYAGWEHIEASSSGTIPCGLLDAWHRRAGIPCPDHIERTHRQRHHAADLEPRPGTAHLPCMCNRYQPGDRQQVLQHFHVRQLRDFNAGPTIVHPREPGWVIRLIDGEPVLDQMTWGFPVYIRGVRTPAAQMKPKPVNNARIDKLGGFWKRWAEQPGSRCLIPATRYAEAVGKPGQMTTTWLSLKSTPVFAWAGLWRESDEWGAVYTAVVTDHAPELASIHDRSPVILAPQDWDTWLNAPFSTLAKFDKHWPANDVDIDFTSTLWKDVPK